MEWIDGEPINAYISRNLAQRQILQSLVRQWCDLMVSLRKAHIAHGDLQHDNILVSGGVLKLIDYDAMYVPALAGMTSHEVGHRNYQHPDRTGRDYQLALDNFSAWVIFSSFSALVIDPVLWNLLNGGDDCLLFRRADFEEPRNSKALRALERGGNLQLQALASQLRSLLSLPLSQIPSLDGSPIGQPPNQSPGQSRAGCSETQGLPGWLSDHITQEKPPEDLELFESGTTPTPISSAEWLFDHLIDSKTSVQPHPMEIKMRDRAVLWSFLVFLGLVLSGWSFSLVSGWLSVVFVLLSLAGCGSFLMAEYRASNPAIKKQGIGECLKARRSSLAQIESEINLTKLERVRLGEPAASIKRAYDELQQVRVAEEDLLNRQLAKLMEGIAAQRRKLQQKEDAAIRKLDHQVQGDVGQLAKKMNSIDKDEQVELGKALQQARSSYILNALNSARLKESTVAGIGVKLTSHLHAAGIRSAADVTYYRVRNVSGIGDAKAIALMTWHNGVEWHASSTAPSTLSQAESSRIRGQYTSMRQSIDQQISSYRDQERKDRQLILNQSATQRRALDGNEESARLDYNFQRNVLKANYDNERARLAAEYKVVKPKAVEAQKRLDGKLDQMNRSLFQKMLEVQRAKFDLNDYRDVNILNYLRLVLIPGRFA